MLLAKSTTRLTWIFTVADLTRFVLLLSVLPRIVPFHFDTPIFAGEAAQVTCLVSQGDSPLEISWSFQGTELLSTLGVTTSKLGRLGSSLLIESASSIHRGNYTCTASNLAGVTNYTTEVEIHGIGHLNCLGSAYASRPVNSMFPYPRYAVMVLYSVPFDQLPLRFNHSILTRMA